MASPRLPAPTHSPPRGVVRRWELGVIVVELLLGKEAKHLERHGPATPRLRNALAKALISDEVCSGMRAPRSPKLSTGTGKTDEQELLLLTLAGSVEGDRLMRSRPAVCSHA